MAATAERRAFTDYERLTREEMLPWTVVTDGKAAWEVLGRNVPDGTVDLLDLAADWEDGEPPDGLRSVGVVWAEKNLRIVRRGPRTVRDG